MPETAIYQIKISLMGTRPLIWRRVLVPSNMTLQQLHRVIQATMGWYDSHLHEFTIGGEQYGMRDPDGGFMDDDPPRSERTARLAGLLGWKGAKARYTYDFGDGWEHQIVVEKVLPPTADLECPACIAGQLACPPEDCGGVGGYYNLLEIIGNPKHEEHDRMLEWLGGPLDPEAFSIEAANALLAPLRKVPKRKAAAGSG